MACSQEPVDATDTYIVEILTCLETTQQKKKKIYYCPIIDWMILIHVNSTAPSGAHWATKTKTDLELEGSWGISMLKYLQKQLQRRYRQWHLKIDTFILTLIFFDGHFIASRVNSKQCANVIFGTPGTAYLSLQWCSIAECLHSFVFAFVVRLYLSSD